MPGRDTLHQLQSTGRDLFLRGLVSPHGGNMSIRQRDRLFITRHGCMLGCLTKSDLVETGLTEDDSATPLASTELAVHRAIYKQTPAMAIVHAHPPHTIALSFVGKDIVPLDMEGSYLLSRVPVIGRELVLKHGAYTGEIAQQLKMSRIVVVYGHGSFAIGQLLEEAFQFTTTLEQSCHIIWLLQSLGIDYAFPKTQQQTGKP